MSYNPNLPKTTIRKSVLVALLMTLAVALTTLPANAWNNVGHRVVAELAWRKMSPAQKRAATDLLKQHPHYKQILTADVPRGVSKDEWAFLTAAVWPDLVRPAKHGQPKKPESVTKYDLYPHAIGYPFLRRGDTNQSLIDNFFIARPDAEMVLSNSIITLQNKKASAHDRAVSLCWVLHLMGDLHQPLHAANLVTKDRPGGDSLGGFHIVRTENGEQISLHSFWDRLPGVDPSYRNVARVTDELTRNPELKPATLSELQTNKTIASWVQESFQIAIKLAYAEDRVQFVHESDLDSGKVKESDIPTLRPDYVREAHAHAQRRLVLAGQRLLEVMQQTW